MLSVSSSRFEQRSDHSLLLRSVGLRDLGPYTCQAYNGLGSPASVTVVAKAVGPVATSGSRDEAKHMRYVVDTPARPQAQPEAGQAYRWVAAS